MNSSKQPGFTIIEVMLYLGVSMLLLAGLFGGITLAVQRQRFSDSVNTTQGFIQKQFSETQNTINDRDDKKTCVNATPGTGGAETKGRGASKCLVAGKLIDFKPPVGDEDSSITTRNVLIAADLPDDYASMDDLALLKKLNPTVVKNPINDISFVAPWGAQLPQLSYGSSSPGTPIRYIALLRSPVSGSTSLYYLNSTADITTDATKIGNLMPFTTGNAARVCVNSKELNTAKALLVISAVASQDGVTSHFDDDQTKDWCP